jgi:dihydroorotate dehydrogenase
VLYEGVARRVLFRLGGGDPEAAHDKTLDALSFIARHQTLLTLLHKRYFVSAPLEAFGLPFPNPVGLAPGLDKDGVALDAWPAMGFGFIEVGTLTLHEQTGNPKQRLFRLPQSEAVINRMGFVNSGAEAFAHLRQGQGMLGVPLGISVGKSSGTALDEALADYVGSLKVLYGHGDYFVLNVSSPNTADLRYLQRRRELSTLLEGVTAQTRLLAEGAKPKPLLVKIAPDLGDAEIAAMIEVCLEFGVAGVVATNTTVKRDGVHPREAAIAAEAGGLSGRPLARRTREVVAFVHRETGGRLPIVGVGGIAAAADALRLFDVGASLVQVCTGLIYHGPSLIRRINRAVLASGRHPAPAHRRRQERDSVTFSVP